MRFRNVGVALALAFGACVAGCDTQEPPVISIPGSEVDPVYPPCPDSCEPPAESYDIRIESVDRAERDSRDSDQGIQGAGTFQGEPVLFEVGFAILPGPISPESDCLHTAREVRNGMGTGLEIRLTGYVYATVVAAPVGGTQALGVLAVTAQSITSCEAVPLPFAGSEDAPAPAVPPQACRCGI